MVGISNLSGVFKAVEDLQGEQLRSEILRHASIYNFIPKERREDYTDGLISAFDSWRERR